MQALLSVGFDVTYLSKTISKKHI